MKKIIGRFSVLILLGAWAFFAIDSGHSHSNKCNEEWKTAFPAISAKPSLQKSQDSLNFEVSKEQKEILSAAF
jgi:hypothetical protein